MRRRTVGVRLAGTWCALLLFLALFGHSSRWWLYFLTAALLVLTIGTLFFALARGPSRGLSRTRLWLSTLGALSFLLIVAMEQRQARPVALASFVGGVLVCMLFFLGWLGLRRR